MENIIDLIIASAVPSIITLITSYCQRRLSHQHSAKQSILQMIMEDEFNYISFNKLPVNYSNIQAEYAVYHDNGGNGEITERVNDYYDWYHEVEKQLKKDRRKKK